MYHGFLYQQLAVTLRGRIRTVPEMYYTPVVLNIAVARMWYVSFFFLLLPQGFINLLVRIYQNNKDLQKCAFTGKVQDSDSSGLLNMKSPPTADTCSYIKTQRDVNYKHRSSHVMRLSWNKSSLVHCLGNSRQAGGGSSSKLWWCHHLNRFNSGLTHVHSHQITQSHASFCSFFWMKESKIVFVTQIIYCSKSVVSESESPI